MEGIIEVSGADSCVPVCTRLHVCACTLTTVEERGRGQRRTLTVTCAVTRSRLRKGVGRLIHMLIIFGDALASR